MVPYSVIRLWPGVGELSWFSGLDPSLSLCCVAQLAELGPAVVGVKPVDPTVPVRRGVSPVEPESKGVKPVFEPMSGVRPV